MKIKLLIIILILTTGSLFSQKIYVWCPKEQIATPRQGLSGIDTIDLVIFDGRVLTPRSKIKCTPEKTINKLTDFIKQTYPSITVNVLNSDQYYKAPVNNRITVKIGISAYHAAFASGEGKWSALTTYSVILYDYRNNNEIKRVKDISRTASKLNTGGFSTAKNMLNFSFIEANQDILFFIDEALMR